MQLDKGPQERTDQSASAEFLIVVKWRFSRGPVSSVSNQAHDWC